MQLHKLYQRLWTNEGSPLKVYGYRVAQGVQKKLGKEYHVELAMRYQNPSLRDAIKRMYAEGVSEIVVFPLFPQYASASTGSVAQKVMEEIKDALVIPTVRIVEKFFDHPTFIEALTAIAKQQMNDKKYDHFVFSYHGLPERQILKSAVDDYCKLGECCNTYHSKNAYCYRAQCFATTRLLAEKLEIPKDKYSICFQSRLGKEPWIQPYIDDTVDDILSKGAKKVLAFSPAFVADCLETTIEIGQEYRYSFKEKGGEDWDLVASLNDHTLWIQTLKEIVENK